MMKYVFKLDELQDIPTFSPPHHTNTTDRKLIDEAVGARHFALWHGEIEPSGIAELHVHDKMEQAFIILEGEALFQIGDSKHILGKDDIAFIPVKTPHQITVVGDANLKILIFMAPPPATLDAWQKQ